MTTDTIDKTRLNGWSVTDVEAAVQGISDQPEAGKLTWRSRAVWDGGFGQDIRIDSIGQLGEELPRHFTMRGDHPPELLGENTGPTAIETLLAALGFCVTGTFAAEATARGIALDDLEAEIEASMDLNGFFGLKPINAGIFDVTVNLKARSDADQEGLDELLAATHEHSPVYDSVTRPIGVTTSVSKM